MNRDEFMRRLKRLAIIIVLLLLPRMDLAQRTEVTVEDHQTITGNKTFTGTTTLGTSGNTALKPSLASDAIVYVSTSSAASDSNDGLSWGTGVADLPTAYGKLPSCTVISIIYPHCGTILLGAGTFPAITGTLNITGPVHIVGIQDDLSVIQCNVAGPCLNFYMSPFTSVHGPQVENVRIENRSSSSSAIGIQAGGVIESVWRNVHIHGFSHSGQISMLWNNPSGTFSERTIMNHNYAPIQGHGHCPHVREL